ncbi:MAG: hypothetical protein PVJ47_06610, partial [Thiohalocapsa sp.]|jgi:putative redox protein
VDDCEADCDDVIRAGADKQGRIERIERRIDLTGDLTEAQRARLLQIADRCPVHRTMEGKPLLVARLAEESGPSSRPNAGD